jgi:predicted YcjX-like family ATPase
MKKAREWPSAKTYHVLLNSMKMSGAKSAWLDDVVHSVKSGEASYINNNGLEAQIMYLLSTGMTAEQIITEANESGKEFKGMENEDETDETIVPGKKP